MAPDPFSLDDPAGSVAPSHPEVEVTLVVGADGGCELGAMSDGQLSALAEQVRVEQQARAVAAADPAALCELGFAEGFKSNGLPTDPWLVGGMLVIPGARVDKSATSHECGFANLDDQWVWECEDLIEHTVRHLPGPRPQMRTVSVVAAYDGLQLDLVASKMRTGVHEMQSVRSFVVTGGSLELVQSRARRADHRN